MDFDMPDASRISFRDIMNLWPSTDAMADEFGVSTMAVRKWWQRYRIPLEYWSEVLAAPRVKSAHITLDQLLAAFDALPRKEPQKGRRRMAFGMSRRAAQGAADLSGRRKGLVRNTL
jgi:hypothetical protein